MDKYEFNIKIEKMKKAVDRKDYTTAARIADSINWERSTNAKVLMMIAQIYEKEERYTEARSALTEVYNRVPVGKRIVYKLTELAVKCNDLDDALELYREYQDIAPHDPAKLILAYQIATARGDDLEKRIAILEAYRRRDFDEKWAYELAALYQQAGNGAECVAICDEIILWFGVGPYVERAMTLKVAYAPLTPEQEEKRANKDYYEQKLEEAAIRSMVPVISADNDTEQADQSEKAVEDTENAAAETSSETKISDSTASGEPAVSPVAKEAELHMTLEQELAQAIQSTSDDLTAEAATNEWITDEPISVDRVGEDVDGQYTLFRTTSEENDELNRSDHTRPFSFGELLTKTRRLDSLRDLAELNRIVPTAAETPVVDTSDEETAAETPVAETPAIEEPMPEETAPETAAVVNPHMIFCHVLKISDGTLSGAQIKDAFREAHQVSGIPAASIARVGVEKINRAGFHVALKKLQGRDLLLEHAGLLTADVISQLLEAIENPPCTAVILFTDDAAGVSELYQKAPALFSLSAEETASTAELPETVSCDAVGDSDQDDPSDAVSASEQDDPCDAVSASDQDEPCNAVSASEQDEPCDAVSDSDQDEPCDAVSASEQDEPCDAVSDSDQDEPCDAVSDSDGDEDSTLDQTPMTLDDFSEFLHQYALDNDCRFDSMAELALAARLDQMELSGELLTRQTAIDLVDRAIAKADRLTFKSIFISRYDKEGYLVIKESHI